MQQHDEGRAYDWGETINEPNEGGGGFILLEPGTYPFRIVEFERGQFPGGGKTPPAKKAIINLEVNGGDQGVATFKDDLILHSNFDWKLAQFFRAIGDRKSGEPVHMHWQAVRGKTGWIKLKHRADKKDASKVYHEVEAYIEPEKAPTAADAQGFNWANGQQQQQQAVGW